MVAPAAPRRVRPCEVCGGQCSRFPDSPHDARNPFLIGKPDPPTEEPKKRPKGKRRPAEDRARHLEEDR